MNDRTLEPLTEAELEAIEAGGFAGRIILAQDHVDRMVAEIRRSRGTLTSAIPTEDRFAKLEQDIQRLRQCWNSMRDGIVELENRVEAVERENQRTLRVLASAIRKAAPEVIKLLSDKWMQHKRDAEAAYLEGLLSILREDDDSRSRTPKEPGKGD